jgi:aryl-alcohol dehydrogenase-like predicted oxidoreductase
MARELGLGVTPWSPLKSGVLSGKYTRENAATAQPDRGAWVASSLHEQAFRVIDVLLAVARELETTPARVALAWVQSRPGVASTIIGARTAEQLEDNLAALEVRLRPEDLAALDEVSRPTLGFPMAFLENVGSFGYGGTTVNGRTYPVIPMAPTNDAERY